MNKDLKYLIKIIKKASKLIDNNFLINCKDENNDLITDFDYKVERFLLDEIKKTYPQYAIISEEFNAKNKKN